MMDGFVAPGFERVRDAFAASFAAGDELGAGFAAIRDGEIVGRHLGRLGRPRAHASRGRATRWRRCSPPPKASRAIVMAWLVDRIGCSTTTTRVADALAGVRRARQRQAHRRASACASGRRAGFLEPIDPALWLDPPACAAAIAALEPMWPPGSASGYHPLTWGYIAGEIAQRASGRSLGSDPARRDLRAARHRFPYRHAGERARAHAGNREAARASAISARSRRRSKAAFFTPLGQREARQRREWRDDRNPLRQRARHGARGGAALSKFTPQAARSVAARVLSQEAFAGAHRAALRGRRSGAAVPDRLAHRRDGQRTRLLRAERATRSAIRAPAARAALAIRSRGVSAGYVMNKQSHHLMGDPRALRLIEALYACL